MSTLKVNTINAATSGQAVAVDISNPRSFRNLVINGAMNIAQRGTSSTSTGYQTVDRFSTYHGGTDEAPTYSQADVSSGTTPYTLGFRKSFKITNGNQTGGGDAGDQLTFAYTFEAQDIAYSGWDYTSSSSYITLSFWIKSSVAQDFKCFLKTEDGTEKGYPFATGSLSANTWTKVTKKIPGHSDLTFDNNTDKGFAITWSGFQGTDVTGSVTENAWMTWNSATRTANQTSTWYTTNDSTLEITGVQLEVGEYATDFEHRSYQDEFQRCLRYYFEIQADAKKFSYLNPLGHDGNTIEVMPVLPFNMRAAPTVTATGTIQAAKCHAGSSAYDVTLGGSDFNAPGNTVVTGHMWFDADSGNPFSAGYFGRLNGTGSGASINFSAEIS